MIIPPISPYGLIQESLWPNEWYVLIVSIMLNRTSRKQVEKVWPKFVDKFPTPTHLLHSSESEISDLISPLGFKNRRAHSIMKMTECYLCSNWDSADQLPGIGDYGFRSWEIFIKGKLGDSEPKDHALNVYWRWAVKHGYFCSTCSAFAA